VLFSQRPYSRRRPSQTHTRSSSFFTFLRSNDNPPSTMSSRSAEPGPRHQNSSDEIGRLSLETRQPSLPSTSALDRSPSLPAHSQPVKLHPGIRSVVRLTHAHAHKVYMSGPLIRRVERLLDGHHPIRDEGWRDSWAQLGGTTLSIWDMKEIDEASKQGKEVPPTYINVTDAVSLCFYHNSCCYLTVVLVCASARRPHDTRVRGNPRSEIQ
jgi:CCR4-NOT transcriptional complex subunit CAF120